MPLHLIKLAVGCESVKELKGWVPKLERLSREAAKVHVLMNNCRDDFAQRNAAELRAMLDV